MIKFQSRTIANSFKTKQDKYLQMLVVKIIGMVILKERVKPANNYFYILKNSGAFSKHSGKNSIEILAQWEKQHSHWVNGDYEKSVNNRKLILSELYQINNVNTENYFPPVLSVEFSGPIGHQAMMGVHIAAQQLGILPYGKRLAFRKIAEEPKPLLDAFIPFINFANYAQDSAWTELPNHWHIAERLQLIKSNKGFIDLYEMIEKVFSSELRTPNNPLFSLPEEYLEFAKSELGLLGLKNDQWFVGLHIRNEGSGYARRNQPIESYIKGILEITSRGGWVIRIGDSSMTPLPRMAQVIDLVNYEEARSDLHAYVLAKCNFFIGTSSGPSSVPPLFGVPTVVTNTTSLGRNVLSAAKNSIYLPKILTNLNFEMLSFEQILKNEDAFGELELDELEKRGLNLLPNTEDDILSAVIEMFDRLDNPDISEKNDFSSRICEIRAGSPWTSQGEFAKSFLEKYQERFLA